MGGRVSLLDLAHVSFGIAMVFLAMVLFIIVSESQHGIVEDGSTIQYVIVFGSTRQDSGDTQWLRIGPLSEWRALAASGASGGLFIVTTQVALVGLTIGLTLAQLFSSAPDGFLGLTMRPPPSPYPLQDKVTMSYHWNSIHDAS